MHVGLSALLDFQFRQWLLTKKSLKKNVLCHSFNLSPLSFKTGFDQLSSCPFQMDDSCCDLPVHPAPLSALLLKASVSLAYLQSASASLSECRISFLCQDCYRLLVTHFPCLESQGERFLHQGNHLQNPLFSLNKFKSTIFFNRLMNHNINASSFVETL